MLHKSWTCDLEYVRFRQLAFGYMHAGAGTIRHDTGELSPGLQDVVEKIANGVLHMF